MSSPLLFSTPGLQNNTTLYEFNSQFVSGEKDSASCYYNFGQVSPTAFFVVTNQDELDIDFF